MTVTSRSGPQPSGLDAIGRAERARLRPEGGAVKPEAVVVGVVLLAGVVLRFVTTSHLWLDEALSVNIARLPLGDIPEALRHDGHPPLYYFLLHGWMSLVGSGDVAVRALSGLLSVATLPLAWVAGRRLGGRAAAWGVVLVLALNPYALRYATETRMYSLVMLLVFSGWLLVDDARRDPSRRRLVAIGLVTSALVLTHYWALWLAGATIGLLALRARRSSPGTSDRRAAVRTAVAVAAGGVLLLPWLPSLLEQAAHTGTPWAGLARPTAVATTTLLDLGGGSQFSEGYLTGAAILIVAVIGLFGRARDERQIELDLRTVPEGRAPALVTVATLAVACAAMYATQTTYAGRYAAVFLPFVFLLAGLGVSCFTGRAARAVVLAGLLLLSAVGAVANVVIDRTQAGELAAAIRDGAGPDDLVIVCPDQLGPSVDRLLPSSVDVVTYPAFGSPERVDWFDYEERNATADPAQFVADALDRVPPSAAVWVVASGTYRTLEGQCEAVVAGLGAARGPELLVAENGDDYFEPASLFRFLG